MSSLYFSNFIFLLALIIWLGSIIFYSFIVTPTFFKNLTPDQAGMMAHQLLSKYFPLNYICAFIALACLIISSSLTGNIPWIKLPILTIMILCILYNTIFLYPRAKSFKKEMMTSPSEDSLLNLREEYENVFKLSTVYNYGVMILGIILTLFVARGLIL